jgi:hypothetical protein
MSTHIDTETDRPVIDEVSRAIARIQTGVLTIVFAALGGLGLFLMTAWLLVKDGPNVGAHLQLLGNYFPGYSVTWLGSLVGLTYGALVGGVAGWSIGTIYNKVVSFRHVKDGRPQRVV